MTQAQEYAEALRQANPDFHADAEGSNNGSSAEEDLPLHPMDDPSLETQEVPFVPGPWTLQAAQGIVRHGLSELPVAYVAMACCYDARFARSRGEVLLRRIDRMKATARLVQCAPEMFLLLERMEYAGQGPDPAARVEWEQMRRFIETGK